MRLVWKIVRVAVALFLGSSILAVVFLRFIPVFITPLMIIRCVEQHSDGKDMRMYHKWVSIEKMSPHLPVAVMASEDQRFLLHNGFDFDAIKKAAKHNKNGSSNTHGASTITQQTVKNVFLWPQRSWLRKGLEAYFTVLVELLWSKQRIMEVYLNSIEMGDGIYGAYSVAKHHFGKDVSELSRGECALIATSLPNPRKMNSGSPSRYMLSRKNKIEREMKSIPSFPKEGEEIDPKTVSGGIYSKDNKK